MVLAEWMRRRLRFRSSVVGAYARSAHEKGVTDVSVLGALARRGKLEKALVDVGMTEIEVDVIMDHIHGEKEQAVGAEAEAVKRWECS